MMLDFDDVKMFDLLGDIADVPKTVANSSIDDADGGVEWYRFEFSSPQSVEVVLRRLNAEVEFKS